MTSTPTPSGPSRRSRRERHGRGPRGPAFAPGEHGRRVPAHRTPRERFDQVAVQVLEDVASRQPDGLAALELAVEEVPMLPASWAVPRVPLATLVPGTPTRPPRLVLFRHPIESRVDSRTDLFALLLTVVVEQVAGHLGQRPEDLHPGYEADD